jgi:hypothetical protein
MRLCIVQQGDAYLDVRVRFRFVPRPMDFASERRCSA